MFSDSICALLDSCKVLIFVVFAVVYGILLIGLSLLSGLPWPESWNPKRNTSAAANGRRRERGNLGFVFRRIGIKDDGPRYHQYQKLPATSLKSSLINPVKNPKVGFYSNQDLSDNHLRAFQVRTHLKNYSSDLSLSAEAATEYEARQRHSQLMGKAE